MERSPRSSWKGLGRFLCGLVAALFLPAWNLAGAASPEEEKRPVEEILKLAGAELAEAASNVADPFGKTSYSSVELIQILKALQGEVKPPSGSDERVGYHFQKIFAAACQIAGPEDVDQLAAIYAAVPTDEFTRMSMLLPLATPWIQRELKALESEKLQIPVFPAVATDVPEHLKDAPAHVLSLWRYAQSVCAPYKASMQLGEDEKRVANQINQKDFDELINQVVLGKVTGVARQLNRYTWGDWLGPGDEMLQYPQSLAMFMCLLRERRLSEAVGASFRIGGYHLESTNPLEDGPNFRKQLWEMCGLDWDRLAVGILLDRERFGFGDSTHLLNSLGADGSARGARLFAAALPFLQESMEWQLRETFEVFLTQPEKNRETVFRVPPRRERTQALPAEAYGELVAVLARAIQSAGDYQKAVNLALALSVISEPKYADLIRPLLKHPAEEVAEKAAETLRAMGEDVPALVKQPPVRFQLFLNGQPLASREVSCSFSGGENFGFLSTTVTTDKQGIAALKPIFFINPATPVKRVSFALENNRIIPGFEPIAPGLEPVIPGLGGTAGREQRIKEELSAPVFSVTVPAPASLQVLTPVIITTYPLTLQFQYNQPPAFYAGKEITVLIERDRERDEAFRYSGPVNITTERVPQLTFSSLQSGDYKLTIHAPGASNWKSKFSINGPKTVSVVLESGADVQLVLKEEGKGYTVRGELLRNGKKFDAHPTFLGVSKGQIYRGLPLGKYTLRVRSTKDLKREYPGGDAREEQIDEQPEYAGIEVDFEITKSSPALIDLGEIIIPRER